jgi:hypothetical protein
MNGVWHHRETYSKNPYSLKRINYDNGEMKQNNLEFEKKMDISLPNDFFYKAELIADDTEKRTFDYQNDPELIISDKYKRFIWFALPKDIASMVSGQLEDGIGFPRSIDEHHVD